MKVQDVYETPRVYTCMSLETKYLDLDD